jgi:hypothetical protein
MYVDTLAKQTACCINVILGAVLECVKTQAQISYDLKIDHRLGWHFRLGLV